MLKKSEVARYGCDYERLEALTKPAVISLSITPGLNLDEFASPASARNSPQKYNLSVTSSLFTCHITVL